MSSVLWCVLNGRAAAPPAIACSVGPSISTKPRLLSVSRIDCTIFVRLQEPRQHAVAVGQVEIPHPLPQLGVGEAVVLFGRRGEALREEVQLLGEDRQLAGLRAAQLAIDADDVAQVEALGQRPVVADLLLADEELDLAGPVADVDEPQLALVAMQHDPAGSAHLRARHFAGALLRSHLRKSKSAPAVGKIGQRYRPAILCFERDLAGAVANIGDGSMVIEPRAPRIVAELRDALQLFAARLLPVAPDAADAGWSVTVELMRVGAAMDGRAAQ